MNPGGREKTIIKALFKFIKLRQGKANFGRSPDYPNHIKFVYKKVMNPLELFNFEKRASFWSNQNNQQHLPKSSEKPLIQWFNQYNLIMCKNGDIVLV